MGSKPNLKEVTIPLPSGSRALDLALSPGGKRLAVLVRHFQHPPLSPFQHLIARWWPRLLQGKQIKVRSVVLYTVRPDGSDWRALGTLPPEIKDHDYDEYHFRLDWLPDGKRLSFIHQDELWTVPVDI